MCYFYQVRASECPADAGSSEASINVISFHVLREHNQSCVHTLLFNWHWMCTPPFLVVTGRKTCSATSSHTHILTYSVSVVFLKWQELFAASVLI